MNAISSGSSDDDSVTVSKVVPPAPVCVARQPPRAHVRRFRDRQQGGATSSGSSDDGSNKKEAVNAIGSGSSETTVSS